MKITKILFNNKSIPSYVEPSNISDLLKGKNINLVDVNLTHEILSKEDNTRKIVKFGEVQTYPLLELEDIENFSVNHDS